MDSCWGPLANSQFYQYLCSPVIDLVYPKGLCRGPRHKGTRRAQICCTMKIYLDEDCILKGWCRKPHAHLGSQLANLAAPHLSIVQAVSASRLQIPKACLASLGSLPATSAPKSEFDVRRNALSVTKKRRNACCIQDPIKSTPTQHGRARKI